jgi:opacity protein-like surface antigen
LHQSRNRKHNFTPSVVAGGAFSHSGNINTTTVFGHARLHNQSFNEGHTNAGWEVGGGLEVNLKLLRISPEIRYMRFTDLACDQCANTTLHTSLTHNPVTITLGLGF